MGAGEKNKDFTENSPGVNKVQGHGEQWSNNVKQNQFIGGALSSLVGSYMPISGINITNAQPSKEVERKTNEELYEIVMDLNSKQESLYKTLGEVQEWYSSLKNETLKVTKNIAVNNRSNTAMVSEFKEIKESIKETKENFDIEVDSFKSDIKDSRNSVLGMIALFASFFSFISISINIFSKSLSVTTSISIVLVLWICLMSFLYVFMMALKNGESSFGIWGMFKHVCVVLLACLLCFIVPALTFEPAIRVIDKFVSEKVGKKSVDRNELEGATLPVKNENLKDSDKK
ncbi:Uncharacterised protein [Serratia entomophila]|uniref:hypothetical protein n=1 Tax=Serratia entomophila TaxID=42906 RepID=UPI00217AFC36|nr:hypothetical protein [Serratia entomophila]CAI0848420.1 Uncharacterised protein [Serratia entomophila]CAI1545401.1 Uncharacterised protein [Serratia entomophila]CAI1562814.1 Uncharacterised protein [Serratia entomophila]CAI1597435.1 Uncharacterised protein [Serratia entomophila]CAI1674634.1 Uncharacterised protein [Serratia entomophila]